MKFLQWLAENQEEPKQAQMDLFGDSQTLAPHERVDGAITNKDLNKTIQSKGGIGKVYQESTDALSEALFDVESSHGYIPRPLGR